MRWQICLIALRNNIMRSAGCTPTVGPKVSSNWLGPNSISSERSGKLSACNCVRRKIGMEAEVGAPRLVDDQRHARRMGVACDRLDVRDHAHVAGLDQEHGASVPLGLKR